MEDLFEHEYEIENSLDELFYRSSKIRSGKKFRELLDFVCKFRKYSPYNNFLVYLQNPDVTYYATAKDWFRRFKRRVKEDARPMLILAPMTPVVLVYDLDDTLGDNMPDLLNDPFATEGVIDQNVLQKTIENCEQLEIVINFVSSSSLHAGDLTVYNLILKRRPQIRINKDFDITQSYATLAHELSHLFLGHLGAVDGASEDRRMVNSRTKELEAESCAYIVCSRQGIKTKSDKYLSFYLKDESDITMISFDLVVKVAGRIEKMGKKLLPKKKN